MHTEPNMYICSPSYGFHFLVVNRFIFTSREKQNEDRQDKKTGVPIKKNNTPDMKDNKILAEIIKKNPTLNQIIRHLKMAARFI